MDKPRFNRTFCSSIGLHRVSFVRASRNTPRSVFFDRLEGMGDGCLLGGPIRRRPILPRPAPPSRRAPPRPDPPVVCPGFGLDKSVISQKRRVAVIYKSFTALCVPRSALKNNFGCASHKTMMTSGGSTRRRLVPGHALHKKCLKRELGVGTMVSNRE